MLAYAWPIALVVLSNIFYQVFTKSTPQKMDPLASLTVTYLVGAVFSAVLYFLLHKGGGNLLREYAHLNAAPFLLGLCIVGLEVGYIYAYRAGWPVSTAAIVQSAVLAVALLFLGLFCYHEALTVNKLIGIGICLVGLWFINK